MGLGSVGKDGTIFIDCMKPVMKWWVKLPGPAKVVGTSILVGAAVGVGIYALLKSSKPNVDDSDSKKTPQA